MQSVDISTEVRTLGELGPRLSRTAFVAGVVLMAAAAAVAAAGPGWGRLLDTYLVSYCFYLTLSLGVTFPFNLTIGIPLYTALAGTFVGG